MRHRRRMQQRLARRQRIDLAEIVQRHGAQIAMAEDCSFRSAGGAAGIEDPRRVGPCHRGDRHAVAARHLLVLCGADLDDGGIGCARRRLCLRCRRRQVSRDEHDRGTAIVENEGDLARMQLGVDRHRHQAGMPARIKADDVIGHVFHQQRDPAARRKREAPPQRGRQGRRLRGRISIIRHAYIAPEQRRGRWSDTARAQHMMSKVHVLRRCLLRSQVDREPDRIHGAAACQIFRNARAAEAGPLA